MPSTAIATAALVIAINAERKAECLNFTSNFDAKTATIAEAKSYASCINELHPSVHSGGEIVLIKAAIFLIFLGCLIGALAGWTEDGFFGAAVGFFAGATFTVIVILVVALVGAGIQFLIS